MAEFVLPAEWTACDGVLLTWPHAATDWAPQLAEVEAVFVQIAQAILAIPATALVVVCHDASIQARVNQLLAQPEQLYTAIIANNDSWARDHGPISVYDTAGQLHWHDFTFTAWGDKFEAALDNAINAALFKQSFIAASSCNTNPLVLEGGAIESDGQGSLLVTRHCLLNPNRNPGMSQSQLEAALSRCFGVDRFLWLDHGYLAGDDTDAHIDTLARFTPNGGIVHVACDDQSDEHYAPLLAMAAQLKSFRRHDGHTYQLHALPWPKAKYAGDERLPASYANYLIINQRILVPTYDDVADARALDVIQQAYPGFTVIGIPCLPLIAQYGSLHCVTMQLPRGTLQVHR